MTKNELYYSKQNIWSLYEYSTNIYVVIGISIVLCNKRLTIVNCVEIFSNQLIIAHHNKVLTEHISALWICSSL